MVQPAAAQALSADAQKLLQWVRTTADHGSGPFAIIDKRQARLWLFDARGAQIGQTPVLLGLAPGDTSVPGIGERPLSEIRPHERTTPAGRFVAEPGQNASGEDIYWIDYDAAVSLHRVRTSRAAEGRLQRLASATAADNRISYGCINVPAAFYDRQIQPLFKSGAGVVYLLPESAALTSMFPGMLASPARGR
ncbi:MAG: L,D-transpeptidase [Chitinophagaceae bacterium]|nr:L,D-transpeptidase [Rubrivivax sp.]